MARPRRISTYCKGMCIFTREQQATAFQQAYKDLPSGQIGSRPSLYRNGRGFESRQLQDFVFLNTLSISPVLVVSECCADVESLYLI